MANEKKESSAKWFSNVAKSLGYSFTEVAEDVMPATIETIKDNKEFIVETAKKIKSLRGRKGSMETMLSGTMLKNWQSVKSGLKNAKQDLKSGTFYRGAAYGIDDGFGDFDLDFDDSEMSFDDDLSDESFDDGEGSSTPSVKVISNINDDNPMVEGIERQTQTMVTIAENEAKRDLVIANENMKLSEKLSLNIHGAIGTVNENVGSMVSFLRQDGASFINASLKYYGESLTHLSAISSNLEKISASMVKPAGEESSTSQKLKWSDAVNYQGVLNLRNYTDLVKKQFSAAADENIFLGPIKMMLSDEDTIANLMKQPLQFIPKAVVNTIVPEFLKESLTAFDKSFKNFIPAVLTRIADLNSDGKDVTGFLSIIAQSLGLKARVRQSYDLGKYEKGPVPFDGVTKKAIVEVIPGYLSKIAAALTGTEAKVFDYESGKFIGTSDVKKNYDNEIRRTALSNYDSVDKIIEDIDSTKAMTKAERSQMNNDIKTLFTKLAQTNTRIKPTSEDFVDQIITLSGASVENAKNIAEAIKKLPKSEQMAIAGMQSLNAREKVTELFDKLEASGGGVANYLNNGLFDNSDMKTDDKGKIKPKSSIFSPADKFGKTALDYLREIKFLMVHGVAVYKAKSASITTAKTQNTFTEEQDAYNAEVSKLDESLTDTERTVVTFHKKEEEKKESIFQKVAKFFFGSNEDRQNAIKKFFNERAKSVQSMLRTADDWMYRIAFGNPEKDKDGKEGDSSFFKKILDGISKPIKKFGNWLKNSFFTPIKDFFFGKDGLIEKFKKSETAQKAKDVFKRMGDYVFGSKDGDGKRSGGMLSDAYNTLVSMKDATVSYFTGKDKDGNPTGEDSVFGAIKDMGSTVKTGIKNAFAGDGSGKNGLFADIKESLKSGAKNFSDLFFGVYDKATHGKKLDTEDLVKKVKDRAPKGLAGGVVGAGVGILGSVGTFGLLGSMFLTPMGAAAIGTATGFLSQSDRFKDWLFGKMDKDTNERIGGVISKSTQNFFHNHKKELGVGATIGAGAGLLGMGIIPSFILGGPLGGAIAGMGVALAYKSKTVQKFLFGEMDETTGKRSGGILNKDITITKALKEKFGSAAVGGLGAAAIAKFGIIGGLTMNPILAAAGGVAAGLLASSEGFKKKLFGEEGEDGKRHGGLLENISEKVNVHLIQPLKIQFFKAKFSLSNWFDESIAEPIVKSFEPLKAELSHAKDVIKDFGSRLIHGFLESKPMQTLGGIFKTIGTKFASGFDKLIQTSFSMLGKAISFPIKAGAGALTKLVQHIQGRRGISSVNSKIMENMGTAFKKAVDPGDKIFGPEGYLATLVDNVKEIRDTVKGYIDDLIKRGLRAAGRGIVGGAKAVGGAIKGGVDFVRGKMGLRTIDEATQARLEDIKSGNRGFWQSVGDRMTMLNPFSSLRKAAKKEGMEYYDGWFDKTGERTKKRVEKRKKQNELLDELRAKNKANKEILGLGRELTDEERESISNKEFNKIIDKNQKERRKDIKSKYGKDAKGKSKMDIDMHLAVTDTSAHVTTIADVIQKINNNGILIRGFAGGTPGTPSADDLGGPLALAPGTNPLLLPAPRSDAISVPFSEATSEDEMTNIQYNSLGVTAAEQNEVDAEKKKLNPLTSILSKIHDKISDGNEETKEHNSIWSSIFSKKGLITGGLLLLSPLILKAIKFFLPETGSFIESVASAVGTAVGTVVSGLWNGIKNYTKSLVGLDDEIGVKEKRTDAGGDTNFNTDLAGALAEAPAKMIVRDMHVANAAARIASGNAKVRDNAIVRRVMYGKGGVRRVDRILNKTNRYISKSDKAFNKANKLLSRIDDLSGSNPAKADKLRQRAAKQLQKSNKFANKANNLKNVGTKGKNKIGEFLTKLKGMLSNIAKMASEKFGASKVGGPITKFIGKILKELSETKLAKFVSWITKKVTAGITKVAASASTAGVFDAVFISAGVIEGLSGAANLFRVPSDQVDAKMRVIAAFIRGLANFSGFFYVDIANELIVAITNGKIDLLHELAVIIYKAISGEEGDKKIDALQETFEKEYNQYTKIQQLAKDNYERDAQGNLILDENGEPIVKDQSLVENRDSYNDRVNKSIWGKMGSAIAGSAKTGWRAMFGGKGNKEKYDRAVSSIENLKAAAERGEIDPESKEYKDAMKTLEKERDANTEKTGFVKTIGNIFKTAKNKLFGTKADKDAYDEVCGEIRDLERAAKRGEVDKDSKAYKDLMDKLVAEKEKLGTKIGLVKKISEKAKAFSKTKAGKIVGELASITPAGAVLKSLKAIKNKLFGQKGDMDDYKDAQAELDDLYKRAERGEIDPESKEYKDLEKKLRNVMDKSGAKVGIFGAFSKWNNKRKYNKAKKKLDKLNKKAIEGKIDSNSKEYKELANKYLKEMEKYGVGGSNEYDELTYTPAGINGDVTPQELEFFQKYGFTKITSGYGGNRTINGVTKGFHHGIDLYKPKNTAVKAFMDGTVERVTGKYSADSGYLNSNDGGGFGNHVYIKDKNNMRHIYAHMNAIKSNINVGDKVKAGDELGLLGSTGSSTGPHLHYEVRDGQGNKSWQNPFNYIHGLETPKTSTTGSSSTSSTDSESGQTGGILGNFVDSVLSSLRSLFGVDESSGSSTYTSNDGSTTYSGSGGKFGTGSTKTAKNLKEEIALKSLQITNANEGNYNTVIPNDNGAYSVGMMGFHLGNANQLFTRMANSGKVDAAIANKFASWSGRSITNAEAKEMEQFLLDNAEISKKIQDEMAMEQIMNHNLKVPLAMFDKGILKDPRSVVLAGDIGNTGPAHLDDWSQKYNRVAPGISIPKDKELSHVRNSLKSSESWWGRQTSNRYYNGWMNRIDKTHDILQNWKPINDNDNFNNFTIKTGKPQDGEPIVTSSKKEQEKQIADRYFNKTWGVGGDNQNTNVVDRFANRVKYKMSDIVQRAPSSSPVDKLITYIETIISELKGINTNTRNTTDAIDDLVNTQQESIQPVKSSSASSKSSSNYANNPMFEIANQRRNKLQNDAYSVAKRIAAGGV